MQPASALTSASLPGRRATFWTLLVGYGAYYLCRANLGVATPLLQTQLSLTKAEIGRITGIATLAYAIGKFTNGPLGDLLGGRRVFLLGLAGSIVANIAFGFSGALAAFIAIWSVNRFFQSAGWMGLVQLVSEWYEQHEYGVVMALLSLSFLVGDAAARGYGAAILAAGFGWQALFFIPALTVAAFTGIAVFTLRSRPRPPAPGVPLADSGGRHAEGGAPAEGTFSGHLRVIVFTLARSWGFWMSCVLSFLLTFLRTVFLDWTADYLVDSGSSSWKAALQSAVFPLTGAAGTLFAGWFSDRVSGSRRGPIAAGMLGGLVASLVLLALVGVGSTALALTLIGAAGFFLLGPYSLLGGCLALDFGGKRAAATAAGINDGVGYLGGSASGLILAGVAQAHGWRAAFLVLAGASGVALLVAIVFLLTAEGPRRATEGT